MLFSLGGSKFMLCYLVLLKHISRRYFCQHQLMSDQNVKDFQYIDFFPSKGIIILF